MAGRSSHDLVHSGLLNSHFEIVNMRAIYRAAGNRSYSSTQWKEELPFRTRGNEIIHTHAIISRNK
jgi:hypothetical protein